MECTTYIRREIVMSHATKPMTEPPLQKQGVASRRVHPTNRFTPIASHEVEQSVPQRFEAQVRRSPDRLAVKTRAHAWTYAELNRHANRLAHAILAQRGGGAEPIAVLFDQGAPAIAAILGVLKAGKFFVPLDPTFPPARLTAMLEDSQTSLLVTDNVQADLAEKLAHDRCRVLNIETLDVNLSSDNPGVACSPDTLAYLLYTSGSTGHPKGVVQIHRNVLHQAMRLTNAYHICADDRGTLLVSLSTASAINDLHSILLNGAALYPMNIKRDGLTSLASWLIAEEITIYRSTPTAYRAFIDTLTGHERFPKLRLVQLRSEPVSRRDVELYKQHFSTDCLFANQCSCTEANTFRIYLIDQQTPISGEIVPVGYAAEDMEVVLFDDEGQEVGEHGVGEIVVRSRYLSPGYWRRPDLTRAVFLPDPHGGDRRLYRTGDVGRLWPDGCLEHLGRLDFRVKIRGYSIEVAEVERLLLGHDAIKAAVVTAQQPSSGDQRLVAYLVPTQPPGPSLSALRAFVQQKLPDYMVPSAFVMLEALPLTPNGKVDRRQLPTPEWTRPPLAAPYVAPRTPIEMALASLWAEVLGLEQVGVHDPFLELGGDSLLAARVMTRVLETFHVELSQSALIEAATVAHMAEMIVEHQAAQVDQDELQRIVAEIKGQSPFDEREHR
jgi:amino acid adenylation domain-containing protein